VRILITGAGGQLGRELVRAAPTAAVVKATERADLDIGDSAAVREIVEAFQPTVILNAAAYTAVDKAESEREQAWRINAHAPALLADAANRLGYCRMVHVSTDYVFSGDTSRRYKPSDETGPIGVYGQSKLEGERAVLQRLGLRAVVLRTAWVYGLHGKNFLHTMLRLMRERDSVRVVADQIGCPTATVSLAKIIWAFAAHQNLNGVYHWSDSGVASWYDFAVAIAEEAVARELLPSGVEVLPIATEDYPAPARRPRFSLLDGCATVAALSISPLHWRVRLRQVLNEFNHG